MGEESTYGTAATMGRHLPITAFEIQRGREVQPVWGMAAGRSGPIDEVVTTFGGSVKLTMQAHNRGLGMLLRQIFGGTVTPVQQAATTAYKQSLTVTDNYGRMLSIQGNLPNTAGTASPFTALGCKLTSAELTCSKGAVAMWTFEFDAQTISEATGQTTPSYTASVLPFRWSQEAVKMHSTFGSEAAVDGVTGFSVKFERPMNQDESYYAGAAGLKSQPVWNDHFNVTGTVEADFVTKTQWVDRSFAHTSTSLMFELIGPIIATVYPETLRFTMPKVKFEPAIPPVPDNGVLKSSVPFKGLLDTTNGHALCDYISLDTAV
jgi:hypothetical protein